MSPRQASAWVGGIRVGRDGSDVRIPGGGACGRSMRHRDRGGRKRCRRREVDRDGWRRHGRTGATGGAEQDADDRREQGREQPETEVELRIERLDYAFQIGAHQGRSVGDGLVPSRSGCRAGRRHGRPQGSPLRSGRKRCRRREPGRGHALFRACDRRVGQVVRLRTLANLLRGHPGAAAALHARLAVGDTPAKTHHRHPATLTAIAEAILAVKLC